MGSSSSSRFGFFEQQLGQRDAHLPAARKLFRAPRPVALRKAEAGEHCAHLRFHGVAVARAKFALGPLEAVGHLRIFGAGRIEFGHADSERLQFPLELPHAGKYGHALRENGAAGDLQPVLRQISEPHALGRRKRAIIELLQAGDNFKQGRLSGTVPAD